LKNDTHIKEKKGQESEVDVIDDIPCSLVVWNDEVNTFDWVITSLMEICKHTHQQAEQSAYIIHFNGKHAVRQGARQKLEPMYTALCDRGLQVTLES